MSASTVVMLDSTDLDSFCEQTLDEVYRYALRLTGGDPALAPPGSVDTKQHQVTIRITDDFDRSEIVVSGFDPDPLLTIEDDGLPCYDLDANGRCDHLPELVGDVQVERVGVGALAGRKIGYGAEGRLWIFDEGRYVEIGSTDLFRTHFIANHLEPA